MRKLFIGGLLVVAALAVAAVAWGATKQTYTQQFTSKAKVNLNTGAVTGLKVQKKEDASAGTVFQASATDPDNPNGQQPQAARRVRIIFPDGTVTDYLAVEQCDADDNEFTDKGEDACDKDTLIGTGYAEVTTNTGTVIKAKVTAFNRKKGLILYIVPEIGQPLVLRPSLKRGPVLETKVAANCVLGTLDRKSVV